jgi:ureidoglycolate dehydrogenase (NAD+)
MRQLTSATLRTVVYDLLVDKGLSSLDAKYVADTLTDTSLDGIDTHGIRLLPTYLRELTGGRANSRPRFNILGDFPAAALFDADHALGAVAANHAMRETIERASHFGIAAMAIKNSNHLGAAGYYAKLAARKNQIGLVFSNSDALVAASGGFEPMNGTNPIAMAAPGIEDDMFLLDMATSQVAFSKVLKMLTDNMPIDPGWVVTSPHESGADGHDLVTLEPLGGYKGQGLGTMVQILCALLTSMPFDSELTHLYTAPFDQPRRIGHFMIAIEVGAFAKLEYFRERLSELLTRFRKSPPMGDLPVIVPGDRERLIRAERLANGIPIGSIEWNVLSPYLRLSDAVGR